MYGKLQDVYAKHVGIAVALYTSDSQPLSDCGPVNSFFYKTRARYNWAVEKHSSRLLFETCMTDTPAIPTGFSLFTSVPQTDVEITPRNDSVFTDLLQSITHCSLGRYVI
jgi:hypothetical protein